MIQATHPWESKQKSGAMQHEDRKRNAPLARRISIYARGGLICPRRKDRAALICDRKAMNARWNPRPAEVVRGLPSS
jgi:hypothetical protein